MESLGLASRRSCGNGRVEGAAWQVMRAGVGVVSGAGHKGSLGSKSLRREAGSNRHHSQETAQAVHRSSLFFGRGNHMPESVIVSGFMRFASICFLIAAGAFAQNSRSFVSVFGNDVNPCTALFQCRTVGRALNVTIADGEIIATASGGYGSFAVIQAVTVTAAPGAYAAVSGGIGISSGPTDRVIIRG